MTVETLNKKLNTDILLQLNPGNTIVAKTNDGITFPLQCQHDHEDNFVYLFAKNRERQKPLRVHDLMDYVKVWRNMNINTKETFLIICDTDDIDNGNTNVYLATNIKKVDKTVEISCITIANHVDFELTKELELQLEQKSIEEINAEIDNANKSLHDFFAKACGL